MKYFLTAMAFVMLTLQAHSHSTGANWCPAGITVTKTNQQMWYCIIVFVSNPSGATSNGPPSLAAAFNAYIQSTTTTTTKAQASARTSAQSSFYVEYGKEDASGGTNRVPMLRWFSTPTGSPVSPTLTKVGANDWTDSSGNHYNDAGAPASFTHSEIADSALLPSTAIRHWTVTSTPIAGGSPTTEWTGTLNPANPVTNSTITVTHTYDFTLSATYTVTWPDTDEDGLDDGEDPYPTDADNNGWGDEVLDDPDGDSIPNWEDPYPTTPGTPPTGAEPSAGNELTKNAQNKTSVLLDNRGHDETADFYVTIKAADNGEIIGANKYTLTGNTTQTVMIGADEAFTVDVKRVSSYELDGEITTDEEMQVNGQASTANTSPSATPINSVGGGSVATQSAGTTRTEATTTGSVEGNIVQLQNGLEGKMQEMSDKLSDIHGGENDDDAPDVEDTDISSKLAKVGEIPGKVASIGTAMGGLVDSLELGSAITGSDSLSWTVPLISGTYTLSLESYADWFGWLRVAIFAMMSVTFVLAVIKIIRGAFVDQS